MRQPPDAKRRPAGQRTDAQDHPQQTIEPSVDPVAAATTFRPGDRVRCEWATPAGRSWSHYAGTVGTVVSVNVVGYGVTFGSADSHDRRVFLFTPDELVPETGKHAPSGLLLDANGEVTS